MSAIEQAIRERAIQALDQSIALSAGAGSGKTSVLTQRILELLLRGTPAARIAAITFTEKSAGELRARVRDGLERRLAQGSTRKSELLGELSRLRISTVHGFCHHLLTAEAFAAGWAPDTEVLPDILEAVEVQDAFRRWEAGFRRRHRAASLVVHQLVTPWTLRAGAIRMLSYRDLKPVASSQAFDPAAAYQELVEINNTLYMASCFCSAQQYDKLLLATRGLFAVLRDASKRPPIEAVVRVLASGEGVRGNLNHGRKADWAGQSKQIFVAAMQRFRSWRAYRLENLHGLLIRDLAEHFVPVVKQAKSQAVVADYDDLLFRAADLLRERPEARRRLAGRFDAVLIDEVQDTDPIQAEVAALLTRDPDVMGEWDAHPPRRGRLFAVGDPQQSIYRFRRADEATWHQLQSLLTHDGERLRLGENFRSVPGIVDWVNATFRQLPNYEMQRAHREPAALDPVVRLPIPADADDLVELGVVVRYLLDLERRGQLVVDPNTGERRPLRWSDVMLLLPSWSNADALQSALTRAGIPCVVEGGGMFLARDEIRLSIAALTCLAEPGDETNTVLVLRGLFALTWDDLARHRKAGGAWRFTIPNPPAGPVADAFALLRRLSRQRGRQSWIALLDELLERSGAAAVWAMLRDGEARLANLDKLRALLRQFEATARSPAEVLQRLAGLDKEQDLSRVDASTQAVRITSYFKSKGLETPVVVLCFGHRGAEGIQAAINRRARRVVIKLGSLHPVDWETYADQERAANDQERRRWMYVAVTRARDQLVIVDRERSKLIREHLANGLPLAKTIDPASLPDPEWRDDTFAGLDAQVDRWVEVPPVPTDEPDPTEQWLEQVRASVLTARAASTSWRSVHELASSERVTGASSPVGVVGGNLIHSVMQHLDFSASLEEQQRQVETLTPSLAIELGVNRSRAQLCLGIIKRMLEHPALEVARHAPEHWIEVPFTHRDDERGCVVSGRIDLAFPTDASQEHWYIVDWKSDLPARDTPGWRNYQAQLERYAQGLREIVSSCRETTLVLVGPYPELASEPTLIERIAELRPELASGMQTLIEQGLPEPRMRAEIGEPFAISVDLAWDARKLALCIDPSASDVSALRALGWQVIEAVPTRSNWADEAVDGLASAFGLIDFDEE